jgi:hypothetical protein
MPSFLSLFGELLYTAKAARQTPGRKFRAWIAATGWKKMDLGIDNSPVPKRRPQTSQYAPASSLRFPVTRARS